MGEGELKGVCYFVGFFGGRIAIVKKVGRELRGKKYFVWVFHIIGGRDFNQSEKREKKKKSGTSLGVFFLLLLLLLLLVIKEEEKKKRKYVSRGESVSSTNGDCSI